MKEKEEIKDLDNIKPIDHGTIAKPHTPVYKMHRYFARRPFSVFHELIKHYSNPGSIVLDPFCGGGVTVVEGLRLKRKVIGVDINPMAIFITQMEVMDADLNELKKAFEEIEAKVKDEILELYVTECPKCGKQTPAQWFELSVVLECPGCKQPNPLTLTAKIGRGRYKCKKCGEILNPAEAVMLPEQITRIKYKCTSCDGFGIRRGGEFDYDLQTKLKQRIKSNKRRYPKDEIPPSIEVHNRALRRRLFTHFHSCFTERNLIALSVLNQAIREISDTAIRKEMFFCFSSMLYECACRLCHIKGGTVVKPGHHFQPFMIFASNNVWRHFERRFTTLLRGKLDFKNTLTEQVLFTSDFEDLRLTANCLLLAKSATTIPVPDNSIDSIITDPPYGGNVNYSELSNFWLVWLRDIVSDKPTIDNREEVVVNSYQGKKLDDYTQLIHSIFKECYRVLKPNRWMVMTFHNRDFETWNSIHLAAHDAGFILSEEDGMIYQPPIQAYVTTLHQQTGGSMLGDFILSFKKAKKSPEKKMLQYVKVDKKIQELAAESVLHHNGASLSTIYMKIMPFLLNNNLLEKIQKKDLAPYLKDSFEERDGKWYLKENLGESLTDYLSNYSRSHYKEDYKVLDFVPVEARLEYLIRRKLYSPPGYATQDEILMQIYSNLINSNAAEYGEISRVLERVAKLVDGPKGKRKVWRLKENIERERQLDLIEQKIAEMVTVSEESDHDLMIRRLVELGARQDLASHIGRTEQKKYTEFRTISMPMAHNVQYGISLPAFRYVMEIDVLWLKGDAIISAFEVEKTTTIDSGINRFRNLFAAQPNVAIEAFLVVPDRRKLEVERKLKSPANIKDSLTEKIGYILFSDLNVRKDVSNINFDKIKNWVRV